MPKLRRNRRRCGPSHGGGGLGGGKAGSIRDERNGGCRGYASRGRASHTVGSRDCGNLKEREFEQSNLLGGWRDDLPSRAASGRDDRALRESKHSGKAHAPEHTREFDAVPLKKTVAPRGIINCLTPALGSIIRARVAGALWDIVRKPGVAYMSHLLSSSNERKLDYRPRKAHSLSCQVADGRRAETRKTDNTMTHAWHTGVLTTSSWHGLEEIGVMGTAEDMIAHGERSNAWPVAIDYADLRTTDGLTVDARAVVASYESAERRALSVVGSRYNATTPEAWRMLCHAAVAAGAKPTGCFALSGGARVLATFDVGGDSIRTQLLLADSFDGTMKLTVGTTSVRVVCANTLAVAMRSDGRDMAQLRHTASLEARVNNLKDAITASIQTGEKVRHTFQRAESTQLDAASFRKAFEMLFPSAPEGASKVAVTRAANAQADAIKAGRLAINKVGRQPGNVGTLWNAATYLVDRTPEGAARTMRGDSDALNSLVLGGQGSRAERIEQIQKVIEVVMTDGTYKRMTVDEAMSSGMTSRSIAEGFIVDAMN